MNTKTEMVATPVALPQEHTPDAIIAQAVQAGASVETMERLFALRKEMKAEAAQEAFVRAMARFQAECPVIEKSKKVLNKDGRTVRYQYAPLDAIVTTVRPILAKCGMSYSIDTINDDTGITATCKVTHELGHSDTSSFKVPVDKEGFMTAPQKVASALTFAKRYAFCNALGILTGDEDTDATDVNKEKKPRDVKAQIVFLLNALGHANKTRTEVAEGVKTLTQLELVDANFDEIRNRLEVLVEERNADVSKTL